VHKEIITYTYIFVFYVTLNETVIIDLFWSFKSFKKIFLYDNSYGYAMFFLLLNLVCYFFVIK